MSRSDRYFAKNKANNAAPAAGSNNCVCMDIGGGKFRCFKLVLGNWQDCGYGEFESLEECQSATGCKAEGS